MIRMAAFVGELPKTHPRLLGENFAQVARNTRLERGTLTPIRSPLLVHSMLSDCQTIYKLGSTWIGWADRVEVAQAPVATERLYITRAGTPQLYVAGTSYNLAVPRPATAPTASIAAGPGVDPALSSVILYAYTYVTSFDEESEPSPLSNELLWSPSNDVLLNGISPAPGGRSINRIRVYRSQTSSLGVTELYFIREISSSSVDFYDNVAGNPIQEPISTTSYNPPPSGLRGIIALANGMMAAFKGKKLYFSEPYRPHAWPEKYVLTVDFNIVGLGTFGSNIAIMTDGCPYVAQGATPDAMVMERLEVNLPCVSSLGIVDLGYTVAYPSTEGLVTVSSSGAQLVTEQLVTREQWQELAPASFISTQHSGRYMASYPTPAGGGARDLLIVDLSGEQPFVIRGDIGMTAVFHEIGSGRMYFMDGPREIKEWDAPGSTYESQTWRSKLFNLPAETNYGAILVEADVPAGTGASVAVIADGVTRATVSALNKPARLPSGFLALRWEVEVSGTASITSITLAASPSELAGA